MKIALIYLAAGNSRRFGSNKLFYEIDGKPMYRQLLDRLIHLAHRHGEYEIYVVTRYEPIRSYTEKVRKPGAGIRCVWSPDSEQGVSYSIRAGLEAAGGTEAGVFFVADQPGLTEATVEGFLTRMQEMWQIRGAETLGCAAYQGIPGNPVWFGNAYYEELRALSGDQGGRKVFSRHVGNAVFYEVSAPAELEDVDHIDLK